MATTPGKANPGRRPGIRCLGSFAAANVDPGRIHGNHWKRRCRLSEKRLLVIDDDPDIMDIVRRIAEGLDFEVRTTARADEFAEIYESFQPTVVILDLVMPEVDGVELAHWLAHVGSKARVIFLTGHNPRYTDGARALADSGELTSVITLTKPVRLAVLRQALG
ncbi:MAG: response regulator [Alphaproteobacteria bacterium]